MIEIEKAQLINPRKVFADSVKPHLKPILQSLKSGKKSKVENL